MHPSARDPHFARPAPPLLGRSATPAHAPSPSPTASRPISWPSSTRESPRPSKPRRAASLAHPAPCFAPLGPCAPARPSRPHQSEHPRRTLPAERRRPGAAAAWPHMSSLSTASSPFSVVHTPMSWRRQLLLSPHLGDPSASLAHTPSLPSTSLWSRPLPMVMAVPNLPDEHVISPCASDRPRTGEHPILLLLLSRVPLFSPVAWRSGLARPARRLQPARPSI
jgi:hypothetical protein